MILGALEKNCFEHISMMAQEQVEIEFREEMHAITANATNGATKSSNAAESTVSTTDYSTFYESGS